jgi:hypothetical protein
MRTVEQYGNQSSASIPCALCGELGRSVARSIDSARAPFRIWSGSLLGERACRHERIAAM